MAKQVLILINIALGIAASIFIYLMLPYAAAIGCGEKHPLPNCQPITATELFLFAAMPLVLVCFIAFLGVRLFPKQRMFSIVLFSAVPVMAILLGAYIFPNKQILIAHAAHGLRRQNACAFSRAKFGTYAVNCQHRPVL